VIKATAKGADGREILVIGLSFGNLDRFRQHPGDTFIRIDGKEMGLPVDVMIISGETEAHLAETLSGGIGPDTKVHTSDRLKS
jgi:hypothetical protein